MVMLEELNENIKRVILKETTGRKKMEKSAE